MAQHYRQGDVLIIAADHDTVSKVIPACTEVERDAGRVVLAYGEVTGHAHAIHDADVTLYQLPDAEVDERFLQIVAAEGATLQHEEHDPITLPPGDYVVRRQREYVPDDRPAFVGD